MCSNSLWQYILHTTTAIYLDTVGILQARGTYNSVEATGLATRAAVWPVTILALTLGKAKTLVSVHVRVRTDRSFYTPNAITTAKASH